LELDNTGWPQKRVMLLSGREKDIFSRLDTLHECDRQTDRHRGLPFIAYIRIASRGKKWLTKCMSAL